MGASTPHTPHARLWPLRFVSVEALSGLVLLAAAALALGWANSSLAPGYEALWHLPLGLGVARYLPAHDLHFWVNDGLMTLFFLVVGLEIRRELHDGSLSDPRVATLPILAAVGGVIVPALLYVLVNTDPVARRGWAIPTATDIAFAVGVLSLIPRVPAALRMLLLTLAIIDDIAAILVIAFFYSGGIAVAGLATVAGGIVLVLVLQWLGARSPLAYVLPGIIVWYGMLSAGAHPTLAGVILGLLTPATAAFGRFKRVPSGTPSPVEHVEALLHPYVAFGIMPLFALANAGVSLGGLDLSAGAPLTVGAGIVLGLVVGKPLGILLVSLAAVRSRVCVLPDGVRWRHMLLLGLLGGIGFTMSIFISNLAFADAQLLASAKFAVLVASALAASLGWVLGRAQAPAVSAAARA
ncbi:MAG: Na+/H+ antiporter NhaA [Steroidobacterales bacterium]|jgi:NhaA family Na+:H+ antiporter